MRDHAQLRAFNMVDDIAEMVYRMTSSFSTDERFGPTAQARRAAVSSASNIVEGCARESQAEYVLTWGILRVPEPTADSRNPYSPFSLCE